MILITIAGFALRRPSLYEFLLFVASLALALQSVRNVALFVAATMPVLINTYGGWWRGVAAMRTWGLQGPARPCLISVHALLCGVRPIAYVEPVHKVRCPIRH